MAQEVPIILAENNARAASGGATNTARLLIAVMRPHQWVKNLFVLAPLLFGRKLTDINAVVDSLLAFAAFCCLASTIYIVNDWLDADDDKAHPEKRGRPISSGALPVPLALTVAAGLAFIAISLSIWIGPDFVFIAAAYVAIMAAYCLVLKRIVILDAITIAGGFVLRVVGGAFAIGVETTHWLIACTFLLALFLAFTKRRQELLTLASGASDHREVLNSYSVGYLEQVNTILIGAAIVCYALYTVAPETIGRFGTDYLIYGTVFVIYGMLRYLALIRDPEKGGNPSKMLVNDKPLLFTVFCWAVYNAAVIYRVNFRELWLTLVN